MTLWGHSKSSKSGWWLTYPSEEYGWLLKYSSVGMIIRILVTFIGWRIWVRQFGWWHSQLNGQIKTMFQTTNQIIYTKGMDVWTLSIPNSRDPEGSRGISRVQFWVAGYHVWTLHHIDTKGSPNVISWFKKRQNELQTYQPEFPVVKFPKRVLFIVNFCIPINNC